MNLDILYVRPAGSGWGPVTELVGLTARLFYARVIEVDDRGEVSRVRKAASALPRGRRRRGSHLLIVAANPAAAAYAIRPGLWIPGYESVAAWIIDSFWTDRTPRLLRGRPHVDHLFITDPDLTGEWAELTGAPVTVLPWGSDTTLFPDVTDDRPVDLLRLGRQPAAWDDDAATTADAWKHGLVFAGRPPMDTDTTRNQANVREALSQSKTVLAFSNLVSPAAYTHPTRDYVTGRWVDALAAGCLVAGTAPRAASSILWAGATLEVSPTSREQAWQILGTAVAEWTPEQAWTRQCRARQQLDWRWRLEALCTAMGWSRPELLSLELEELRGRS